MENLTLSTTEAAQVCLRAFNTLKARGAAPLLVDKKTCVIMT